MSTERKPTCYVVVVYAYDDRDKAVSDVEDGTPGDLAISNDNGNKLCGIGVVSDPPPGVEMSHQELEIEVPW